MKPKIIGVGFQKTGTSTLREALKILGYTVKDTSSRPIIPIIKGNYGKVLRMIKNYDAIEDTPWYMIYKELDALIPGSKFILTIRDEESWYKSVSRQIGDLRSPQLEWIYGRGKGLPKDDKANTIQVYSDHNKEVMEYFKDRPEDLLVLDFTKGDKWEKLCAFLNKEVPAVAFPHANKTKKSQSTELNLRLKFKYLRKRIRNNLKMKYMDLMGYWPDKY